MTQISSLLPYHSYPGKLPEAEEPRTWHPLFQRVGLNVATLVTGLGLVTAVSGCAMAILSGAFSTAMGFFLLGAIVVYNFYEGQEVVVLNKAIETLKLSREHLTQTCFDLKITKEGLEMSNQTLQAQLKQLQAVNSGLEARILELNQTNQNLQYTLGGFQYQLHIIHNGAKIFQENLANIQATQMALSEVQAKLAGTQYALSIVEQNLVTQTARLAEENVKYALLNQQMMALLAKK